VTDGEVFRELRIRDEMLPVRRIARVDRERRTPVHSQLLLTRLRSMQPGQCLPNSMPPDTAAATSSDAGSSRLIAPTFGIRCRTNRSG
jgi:hypothetical protein